MRLLQQDRRASYDTSSWQPAAHSRGIDALPISESPACLPPMEKMEGEPGRDAKADQVQKTQCKDTTSHCFMRVLIENNTDGSAFRPLHTRCNGRTLTIVFGMILKYQSHVFWDTGQVMGPWQSHRGNGAQRQMWWKTFNDELVGAHIRHKYAPVFFCSANVTGGARDFFPRWVTIEKLVGWSVPACPVVHCWPSSPVVHWCMSSKGRFMRQSSVCRFFKIMRREVPCLPRKVKVDVAKRHACHAKCRGVTGAQAAPQAAPKRATGASPVRWVPRLPRKTKVDVVK